MDAFPEFMRNPLNRIARSNQATPGAEGYVFDGVDQSQMAFWTCTQAAISAEHIHEFDEYMLVVQGCYTLLIDGTRIPVKAGEEYLIPRGVAHSGEVAAGTRTIHAFGVTGLTARRTFDALRNTGEPRMKIAAGVSNTPSRHSVEVETEGRKQSIAIAPKSVGRGSSINGGELLFAALATCFCNDLYREAAKRGIDVQDVRVEVIGTFGNPGEPARDISYLAQVQADAPQATIDDLICTTDSLTEIQNTLRSGCAVRLEQT